MLFQVKKKKVVCNESPKKFNRLKDLDLVL
jgi:hypothetical protein